MAYTKQNFTQGQVLTAPHLNHIENGIAQNDVAIAELTRTVGFQNHENVTFRGNTTKQMNEQQKQIDGVKTDVVATNANVTAIQQSVTNLEAKVSNDFATAIKGTANGAFVSLRDVSPLERNVKVSVSGVSDPTSIKLIRRGKNLLTFNDSFSYTSNGLRVDYDKNLGVFVLNGSPTANSFSIPFSDHMDSLHVGVGTKVSMTVEKWTGAYTTDGLSVFYLGMGDTPTERSNWFSVPFMTSGSETNTQIASKPYFTRAWIYIGAFENMRFTDYTFRVWVELGDPTYYEDVDVFDTYVPSRNGEVDGVTSLSQTMNLFTNNKDALVSVEYNRDSTTVINDLLARVSALENA